MDARPKAVRPGRIRRALMGLRLMPPPTLALAPGVDRWAVKTGGDPASSEVRMTPVVTTIAALRALPAPHNPMMRTAPVEFTVYQVEAILTEAHLETDGDAHLILSDDQGFTMIAEAPHPPFVPATSPWLAQVTEARSIVDSTLGPLTAWPKPNRRVRVLGPAFYDRIHGQAGVAINGVEIHPVLSIVFL